MDHVWLARAQMGMSLAFHIVFASVGMAMPILMVLAERKHRKTADPEYLELAKRWSKGTAVFFAVGAVSGTVLSFELGLLFPGFMRLAGPAIGMPFSLEGFAFFAEAIFLGVYLYGWQRVSPRVHELAGWIVAVSGGLSALFVTLVNAWMNAPQGFRVEGGKFVDVDPWRAAFNAFSFHEVVHGILAAYMATAAVVAGIHAFALLRRPDSTFDRKALVLALWLLVPCALVQPLIGHHAGQVVAEHQPLKLASLEQHMKTSAHAPMHLGPIEIPSLLSVMAFNDPAATVQGLEDFPREDWPSPIVRPAFLFMVGVGTVVAFLCALWAFLAWRRREPWRQRWWLRVWLYTSPLSLLALEAGWIVTEVGRQPWAVYGVLRTRETVTPMTHLLAPLLVFSGVYLVLAFVVLRVLREQVREAQRG